MAKWGLYELTGVFSVSFLYAQTSGKPRTPPRAGRKTWNWYKQASPYYDSRRRTNYAQKGHYFSHVEHWYWIPSADRREDADRQILQPVVTVTQSELWNQRVTVINHISDLSRTNRVDATGDFTSPKVFINCVKNTSFADGNLKHSWWHDSQRTDWVADA